MGSEGPPPEIFKNLDCKCCNQNYSGALFVNKGGLRVHPRKLKKNDCKCNNQSYSGASFVNKGGLRVHPRNFQKTRLQMLQSEIFWSFICVFFLVIFFFDSGATPFFPEQFAAMPRTSMCLKKWGQSEARSPTEGGSRPQGSSPGNSKKNLHYGSCSQNYSGALLVNKISLVFLQSIKVILKLKSNILHSQNNKKI